MSEITRVKENLYLGAGNHPRKNTKEFEEQKFDVVISCCKEITHESNLKYIVHNYPLDDGVNGTLYPWLGEIAWLIKLYLDEKKKIYIHCVKGRSRSAAIIIYYLMRHCDYKYDDASKYLMAIRPAVCMNHNFIKELKRRK